MDDAARDAIDMTSLLSGLMSAGQDILAVARTGPWGEIDSVEDLAFYEGQADRFGLTLGAGATGESGST